jgi:bifunctional non-homologous end joining protein LigD
MSNEKISLYFSEGSSDKEYHAELVAKDGGFVVNFRYGRRGSTLTAGTKTASPLPLAKAKVLYDKIVKEKTAKGYSTGEAGNAYQHTELESRVSGLLPQLLNSITEEEMLRLLADDVYGLQEKLDGKRAMLRRTATGVEGVNRKGLIIALPQAVVNDAERIAQGCVIDGELIGEVFFAFDLLEFEGADWRHESYYKRSIALKRALQVAKLADQPKAAVREVPVYLERHKRPAYEAIKTARREGVVFKLLAAPYTVGRPASGGSQLKYKFVESATARVKAKNGTKRSVALELTDAKGNWVGVGNVTIPSNYPIPDAGSLVEVKYLYAYVGGSLYQPQYLGVRDDQDESACTLVQLKFKAESSEEDEA